MSLASISLYAQTDVNVVGLFAGKAVVVINQGKPKTLTVGDISEGVKLIAADSNKATFDIEGKRQQLTMGQAASIKGAENAGAQSVVLYATSEGHFVMDGSINGAMFKFLVDTGATTTVALNANDAKRAGLRYESGQTMAVQTASGVIEAHRVTINTIKLGSLVLNQVEALVVAGDSPPIVLLGMTALNRVEMKRDGITLTLTKKF